MSERDEALKRLADAGLLTARFAPSRGWKTGEFWGPAIIATKPMEFTTSASLTIKGKAVQGVKLTAYPGWRFVRLPDGLYRHEKIPTLWQRIVAAFTPPTNEADHEW